MGDYADWFLGHFAITLDSFLAFWCDEMFWDCLVHFLPQTWNQLFLQEVLAPFSGEWYLEIKIWELEVILPVGLPFVSRPFQRQVEHIFERKCYKSILTLPIQIQDYRVFI